MKKVIINIIKSVSYIIFIALFFTFFRGAEVHGSSMYPVLEEGDFFLLFNTRNVSYGDIISLYSKNMDTVLCKRVIGLSGDRIELRDGVLYRNGVHIEESYILNNDTSNINITVSDNEVFVLGDNRVVSMDSRSFGCVSVDDIIGKLLFKAPMKMKTFKYLIIVVMLVLGVLWLRELKNESR